MVRVIRDGRDEVDLPYHVAQNLVDAGRATWVGGKVRGSDPAPTGRVRGPDPAEAAAAPPAANEPPPEPLPVLPDDWRDRSAAELKEFAKDVTGEDPKTKKDAIALIAAKYGIPD